MTTNPADAPPEPPVDTGPRVDRDDVRDLARLRRSRTDRKIAGVAGGLARHLDIDPIIPRVLLVVLVFFGGSGLILYAALWLFVPAEGTGEVPVRLDERSRSVALIIAGTVAGLALVGDALGGWQTPWPAVVLAMGVLVVLLLRGGERRHPSQRWRRKGPDGSGWAALTDDPAHPHHPGTPGHDLHHDRERSRPDAYGWLPQRRRGPVLFWYALALIALGTGVLGVVDTAGADVPVSAYPAVALGTCAALLLLGAFWGRAGGLILLGLLSGLATAVTTAADEVDAGRVESRPTSAAAVQDRYDLAFGEIVLDLGDVADPTGLDGRTVEVEVEVAGRIEVVVPDDVTVTVRSRIEVGERSVLGDRLGDGEDRTTSVDGGPDAPELVLDVRAAFGEIEITREGDTR